MAKGNTGALHSNPHIAAALAKNDTHKYDSMEAWGKAHKLSANERRAARQVLRDNGEGVGRGRRYVGTTTAKVKAAARKSASASAKEATAKQTTKA